MLSDEKIESNFKIFLTLCGKLGDRSDIVTQMVEDLGERLALAPASTKFEYHSAFPGGLVDHSLRVLQNLRTLNTSFKTDLPSDSMIVAALFHDFGKVGDLTGDCYEVQNNSWRRDNLGEAYTVNKKIQKMPNAERGLFMMQHYGVKLSLDEWIAIRTNDGQYTPENSYYKMHEPTLALLTHMADRLACDQEKEIWESEQNS